MRIVGAVAAALLVGFAASATQVEVRVRLQHAQESIEVSGLAMQIGRAGDPVGASFSNGVEHATIRHLPSGVWLIKSGHARTWAPVHAESLAVRGQMLRLGITPAPYDLELFPNLKHGIDVVSRMDLETYLGGVLPSEMPAAWHIEALKAQAVAARSFVMRTAFERRSRHYDVDSTIFDQVYKFYSEVKEHPEWGEKVTRALKETRGEVLVDSGRRILKAFYSADCGCQTEDPKFVWGKTGAFASVKDPSCGSLSPRTWKLSLERKEVREKLIAALGLPAGSGLRTVNIGARSPSGRVAEVVASFDIDGKSRNVELKSQDFRRIIGFERVRSTDFHLRWMSDLLEINGQGIGHGVGLCQRGAHALAGQGRTYRDILKLYYPKAKLVSPKSV